MSYFYLISEYVISKHNINPTKYNSLATGYVTIVFSTPSISYVLISTYHFEIKIIYEKEAFYYEDNCNPCIN